MQIVQYWQMQVCRHPTLFLATGGVNHANKPCLDVFVMLAPACKGHFTFDHYYIPHFLIAGTRPFFRFMHEQRLSISRCLI